MRSLSEILADTSPKPGWECWPEQKEDEKSVFLFLDQECFQQKRIKKSMVKRHVVTRSPDKTAQTLFSSKRLFSDLFNKGLSGERRKERFLLDLRKRKKHFLKSKKASLIKGLSDQNVQKRR